MDKLKWEDAPEWATHMIIGRYGKDQGVYRWTMNIPEKNEWKIDGTSVFEFHPDGWNVVEARPK